MAQKAKKDLAKSNASALFNLHITSLVLHALFLLHHFVFPHRTSLLLYLGLATPSFLCQYVLERAGRPKRDPSTGALRSAGEDLSAPGLTDYMFDTVWVTWGVMVLVALFGDWVWWLWSVVPAFAVYKGFGLLGMARQMAGMGGMGAPGAGDEGMPAAGNRKQRRAAA